MTGDKEAKRMMRAVAAISARFRNATLAGKTRKDGGNNATVAEGLRDQGRNFFETQKTADAAAKAFARMTEVVAMKAKRQPSQSDALIGQVWIAAMKAASEAAAKNINDGNFEGGGSTTLSEAYAIQKAKPPPAGVGFTMPIGKATGDLLNNLAAAGTIRLHKA
jgi:hypothetical protein